MTGVLSLSRVKNEFILQKTKRYLITMVKVLICYYSKSGTTEKMAKEISKGMRNSEADVEVDCQKVEDTDVEKIPEYDGLVLGSPTYYGLPAAEIKDFIDKSITHHGDLEGMIGGAFASSANTAGGNETTAMAIIEALLIHGMVIKGTSKGDHYAPVVIGDPDAEELEQCRNYGEWLAEFIEDVKG